MLVGMLIWTIGQMKQGKGWAMEIKHSTHDLTQKLPNVPYFLNMSE